MRRLIFIALAACIALCLQAQETEFNIIPMPRIVTPQAGHFTFTDKTQVAWRGEAAEDVAKFFCEKLKRATGISHKPIKLKKEGKKQPVTADVVRFVIDPNFEGSETYHLEVTPTDVTCKASTHSGLFYALQTLLQLMPPRIESQQTIATAVRWDIPAVVIDDAPRFRWRGVHLDPCRHFLPVAAVKKQIDMLATLKINKLHFHLTEDQGWRIQIKKYPELTSIGARRFEAEGTWHEGYYTQDEIRDIVAYAARRGIEVVPELEMPGHGLAAIAAYPELSCRGDSITPRIIWGVEDIVMCPGKEDMFQFLQDVIDEMVPLFPSKYFHIGGDESPRKEWEHCPKCQARMKELGYTREAQLQDYVIERIAKYLADKGKVIIGWDEILEGGNLEPSAIVMSWRGEKGGIEAVQKHHHAIMSPGSQGMYFDHYQGDPITEPTAIGGYAPLEKVYNYDPVPDALKAEGKGHYILGVQGNNWSEYFRGPAQLEYHLYPRALALAEIAWTPAELKDYDDFRRRLLSGCLCGPLVVLVDGRGLEDLGGGTVGVQHGHLPLLIHDLHRLQQHPAPRAGDELQLRQFDGEFRHAPQHGDHFHLQLRRSARVQPSLQIHRQLRVFPAEADLQALSHHTDLHRLSPSFPASRGPPGPGSPFAQNALVMAISAL